MTDFPSSPVSETMPKEIAKLMDKHGVTPPKPQFWLDLEALAKSFDFAQTPAVPFSRETLAKEVWNAHGGLPRIFDELKDVADLPATTARTIQVCFAAADRILALSDTSTVRPCDGCDGHECDNGCAYPGAVSSPLRSTGGK